MTFRTRKEIEDEMNTNVNRYQESAPQQAVILQVTICALLLDIRDLLANPPVEISGQPLSKPTT